MAEYSTRSAGFDKQSSWHFASAAVSSMSKLRAASRRSSSSPRANPRSFGLWQGAKRPRIARSNSASRPSRSKVFSPSKRNCAYLLAETTSGKKEQALERRPRRIGRSSSERGRPSIVASSETSAESDVAYERYSSRIERDSSAMTAGGNIERFPKPQKGFPVAR